MTSRREVLQGLIVSIGGASMLSACGGTASILPSSNQSLRFYSEEEYALVSRISDLIIPRTDTPGALDASVPGFMDSLMAEWASADTKVSHREQLADIQSLLGDDFTSVSRANAESTLAALDQRAFTERDGLGNYRSLKGLITQCYFASEEGAQQELGWVAVPGRWDGCVEI